MMPLRCSLIATLLAALTACTMAPPSPPTSNPTPGGASTPNPLPTHTPRPTPTPAIPAAPTPRPTLPSSPVQTPNPDIGHADVAWSVDPPSRPFAGAVVNPEPPRRVPNAVRSFWVTEASTGKRKQVTARLRVQLEHVAVWVEEGVWHDVGELERAARLFETKIYPTTRNAFGSEWTPGVDNDPHIHVLHATDLGEGVPGYFASADELPRDVYRFSNEAEIVTVNLDTVEVGSPAYHALLAREFQRLIQWNNDRNEERWLKEGLAELAVRLNGFAADELERAYLERPDISLTAWTGETAQRGAARLLAAYFYERFDDRGIRALTAQPLNGAAGLAAALEEMDARVSFDEFFADWLAANYLDSRPEMGARTHNYATLDLGQPTVAAAYDSYPITMEASVEQFGADYILLDGDADLRIQFSGASQTPLLDVLPHSERYFWWSNRADQSLTTLTRRFDLSPVEKATLTYWTWYDIEADYDYATVEVSADDGGHWQILSTPSGTGTDPRGNNPGWGYTGQSNGWILEEVDLSSYAGEQVLVRFAYLTDEAVTGAGFLVDDVAIPELGYTDDAESATTGWTAAGFVRTDNSVPQSYVALLIGIGDEVEIKQLQLPDDGTAEWIVPLTSRDWHEAVLVISGIAPLTTRPASYRVAMEGR